MRADDLIRSGLNKGQKALSEYDSKKLLGLYGIAVTREKLCHSADEAVSELDINPMSSLRKVAWWPQRTRRAEK